MRYVLLVLFPLSAFFFHCYFFFQCAKKFLQIVDLVEIREPEVLAIVKWKDDFQASAAGIPIFIIVNSYLPNMNLPSCNCAYDRDTIIGGKGATP